MTKPLFTRVLLRDLDAPAPPAPLPKGVWKRMCLAKQRLAALGPLTPGRDAFLYAVLVIAAELRLHAVPEETAVAFCRAIPFTTGDTPRRRVLRSVKDYVRFAYHPPDGLPLLSGCAGTAHHSATASTSRMRDTFAQYCDDDCQATCPMLRGERSAGLVLAQTQFAPVYDSSLWAASELGQEAKRVYGQLALIALYSPANLVLATGRWLCLKFGGELHDRTIRRRLEALERFGLISTVDKHPGLRTVHALAADDVRQLERAHGTRETAESRMTKAREESREYGQWIAENRPTHDHREENLEAELLGLVRFATWLAEP